VRTEGELVEEVVDTNLMGTIWGCQYMAKGMMRRKRGIHLYAKIACNTLLMYTVGCIINISSLLGVKGGRGSAAYAASKAGVIGMAFLLDSETKMLIRHRFN
jgi:NAD(P)-dependent dehydrogenase (short-subunit alcohol dehydrogenase family)